MDSPKLQNFNSKRGQQLPQSLYLSHVRSTADQEEKRTCEGEATSETLNDSQEVVTCWKNFKRLSPRRFSTGYEQRTGAGEAVEEPALVDAVLLGQPVLHDPDHNLLKGVEAFRG